MNPSRSSQVAGEFIPIPEVGARIKDARLAKEWSLSDLAQATGLSSSFISLVENGKSDISMRRLVRLMESLDISFIDFTDANWRSRVINNDQHLYTALSRDDRPRLTSASGMDVELLIRSEGTNINRFLMTIHPGEVADLSSDHGGRQSGECFQLVLKGTVNVHFGNGQRLDLKTGDSMVSRLEHGIRCNNASRADARVYVEVPIH
jgi:transcriptional regulator with XRE-family HTH domain